MLPARAESGLSKQKWLYEVPGVKLGHSHSVIWSVAFLFFVSRLKPGNI